MSQVDVAVLIPAVVKQARRKLGLSVRAAARQCGISAPTLSRLERGDFTTMPDSGTLKKLAKWLRISVSVLLGAGDEEKKGLGPAANTPDLVEAQLLKDARLRREDAQALAAMFRQLYERVAANSPRRKKRLRSPL
jgi:transcriptional regulator with XRE-family HTH domain